MTALMALILGVLAIACIIAMLFMLGCLSVGRIDDEAMYGLDRGEPLENNNKGDE